MIKPYYEESNIKIYFDDLRIAYPLFRDGEDNAIPDSPIRLKIEEAPLKRTMQLNELWHSRLPKTSFDNLIRSKYKVCYWALYKNICYAVAIWTSPIGKFKDYDEILELRRLAISEDAPKYTASRMISIMIKMIKKKFPQIKKLISYQDCEFHKGTIYRASNWKCVSKIKARAWNISRPDRNKPQALSEKIRWEYYI